MQGPRIRVQEDVLEVYHREYQDNEVLVCLDETSKQLRRRHPLPPRSQRTRMRLRRYQRNGVSNLFMLFAPLEGWPGGGHGPAHQDRLEVGNMKIVLVMRTLNTHHPASLYEAFEPGEARRIAERLEIHYTPKHGSWLNIAEIWGCWRGSAWTAGFPAREFWHRKPEHFE